MSKLIEPARVVTQDLAEALRSVLKGP